MPSNLTPVKITDKNGKQTTVHKKTAAAPKRTRKMPAPKPDYTALARQAMTDLDLNYTYSKNALETLAYLAEKSPKLLNEIKEQCSGDGLERKLWKLTIEHRSLFSGSDSSSYANLNYLHAMHNLMPLAVKVSSAKGEAFPAAVESVIEKTYNYGMRFRGEPILQRAAVVADAFIVPDDVDSVIFDYCMRLTEVEDLIPELAKRGQVDKDTFDVLMDSDNVALRDGEL